MEEEIEDVDTVIADPGNDLEKTLPLSNGLFVSVLRVSDGVASYIDMTVDEVRDHIARRCTRYTTTKVYPKYFGKEITWLEPISKEYLMFCYANQYTFPNYLHHSDQMKILRRICYETFIIIKIVDGYAVELNNDEKKMIMQCKIKFDSSVEYDPFAPK